MAITKLFLYLLLQLAIWILLPDTAKEMIDKGKKCEWVDKNVPIH